MVGRFGAFLLDTNLWIERLLDQERADEVARFLDLVPSDRIHITGFALNSIGILLTRMRKFEVFDTFVQELLINRSVGVISLGAGDMRAVTAAIRMFSLDYDDAYHYVAAKMNAMVFLSFDKDFDKTDIGRKTPSEALEDIEKP